MILYILVGVIGIIAVLGAIGNKRKKSKNLVRVTAEFTALVEKAEAGDTEIQYGISKNKFPWPALLKGNPELKQRYGVQGELGRQNRVALEIAVEAKYFVGQRFLDTWLDESARPEERLSALSKYYVKVSHLSYKANQRKFLAEAVGLKLDNYARSDEDVTLAKLQRIFRRTWRKACRRFYQQLSALAGENAADFRSMQLIKLSAKEDWYVNELNLKPPKEWNEWALRHIEVPAFSDFVRQQEYHQLPHGTISLRMAKALSSQDALELAITLSYCHNWSTCRKEVGDVLYAEATKMYELLRKRPNFATI